jgi:hypothetical protein
MAFEEKESVLCVGVHDVFDQLGGDAFKVD